MKQNTNLNQISINALNKPLWEVIYLKFGVYDFKGKSILFEAKKGPFASTAWIEGDKEYNYILGRKFDAVTGDDNCIYNLNRDKIRRLKSEEEFYQLLRECCESFRNSVYAYLHA